MSRALFHRKRFLAPLLLTWALAIAHAHAEEDTTLVPLDQTEAPAADLVHGGHPIDQDQAVSLRTRGVDLSVLDPVPNDMWGRSTNLAPMPMPTEGATLDYDSSLAGFGHEISIHRVTRGSFAYRLDISTVSHRALLTRALLARLGYNQYAPRRYARLKIRFRNLNDRQSFLDSIAFDTVKDPATWIQDLPSDRAEVTLKDIVLEPGRIELQNYYWATLPTNFSEGRRALRALLVPISLCNSPENIDGYRWDFGRILNNAILVSYPREIEDQRPFDSTTIDDMRWSARKIAELSLEDWRAIVAQADYPADIAEIVLQKLIARRNHLLANVGIEAAPLPYDVHLTNDSVRNGQVVRSTFDGYASRFTYGDAEDPMSASEMKDLGLMQLISSGMQTLASQISEKMILAAPSRYLETHIQEVAADFFKHLIEHPNEPYSQPISTWGGPVGGFGLTASRQLSTGTFYGSNAAIQLVDTVGFSGSLGYFRGIDGIKNAIPGLQANVTLARNYTHLRAMPSISAALKVSAQDFIIPSLLNDLSTILDNPTAPEGGANEKSQALNDYTRAIENLLSKIQDGEMFTITDTLTGGVGGNVKIPAQAFFPSAPVGYNQSLSFGAGAQAMIVKRTTLRRVRDELGGDNFLQVYVQSLDTVTGNLTLDFNYWLNIAHFGIEKSQGKARTRVYTIKSDPNRAQESAKSLANSLRSVLKGNSDSALKASYPFYLLQHDIAEDETQFSFLFFQMRDLEETHRLRIQPPLDPEHPFDPKEFERTFYSHRKLKLSGSNYLSFVSDIVDAASKAELAFSTSGSGNPAFSPFGNAHWTEMYSDVELTAGRDYSPVTIARESWGGWSISQRKLFHIFDELDAKLAGLKAVGLRVSPIHRDIFAATDKLEFYNLTATTIFYPAGIARIVSAVQPSPDPRYRPHGLFERWTKDGFSASDRATYDRIVPLLGGEAAYLDLCQREYLERAGDAGQTSNSYIFKGNTYSCLSPWMQAVLEFRRTRPLESLENREALVTWHTRLISLLEEKIPHAELLKLAGQDGFFFQVRVNGFRQGDHEAKDSERQEIIASYVSDSVGTADQHAGAGAFNTLADKTQIMPYEISGLFFGGGY